MTFDFIKRNAGMNDRGLWKRTSVNWDPSEKKTGELDREFRLDLCPEAGKPPELHRRKPRT
jgi:hypothetical protein